MKTAAPGELTAAVITYLQECGEGTRAEIARSMGRHTSKIGSVLHRMLHKTDTLPKRVYIKRYTHFDDAGRYYPRPVYALGDKKNALKPRALSNGEHARNHRERRKLRAPSIFIAGPLNICCSDRP